MRYDAIYDTAFLPSTVFLPLSSTPISVIFFYLSTFILLMQRAPQFSSVYTKGSAAIAGTTAIIAAAAIAAAVSAASAATATAATAAAAITAAAGAERTAAAAENQNQNENPPAIKVIAARVVAHNRYLRFVFSFPYYGGAVPEVQKKTARGKMPQAV